MVLHLHALAIHTSDLGRPLINDESCVVVVASETDMEMANRDSLASCW